MRDVRVIELNVDPDGALVTLEAAIWYVCFVPGLDKQWWHRFANKRHKHVFAMRPAGPGMWTLFEPWWHRLLTATITSVQAWSDRSRFRMNEPSHSPKRVAKL